MCMFTNVIPIRSKVFFHTESESAQNGWSSSSVKRVKDATGDCVDGEIAGVDHAVSGHANPCWAKVIKSPDLSGGLRETRGGSYMIATQLKDIIHSRNPFLDRYRNQD